MIRIGILSLWHVHSEEYLGYALEHPDTEVTALWDEQPQRGSQRAAELGIPFEADLDALLARDDVDAVICDAPTTMHPKVLVKAAQAGKHIFTEKVVTATNDDLGAVLSAVRDAGVTLTVSLPRLYDRSTLAIDEVVQSGKLGQITFVRVRLSHGGAVDNWLPDPFYDPALTVGGAMIDLGCHPVYLTTRWLGGLPETVAVTYSAITRRAVEDSAVAVLKHSSGAIGVAEAGFVNRANPFEIEVHGTNGSLFFGTPDERLRVKVAGEDDFTDVSLPERQPMAFWQFVDAVKAGTTTDDNLQRATWLTQVMDAAQQSHEQGGAPVAVGAVPGVDATAGVVS